MNIVPAFIGNIIDKTAGIIDKAIPDKDQADRLKHELEVAILQANVTELQEQASVVRAEAQGASWLQRNWRPITMLCLVYIIVNNYIIAPYARCFYTQFPIMEIPSNLWDLLKLGIGGYVVGRSAEKIATSAFSNRKKDK